MLNKLLKDLWNKQEEFYIQKVERDQALNILDKSLKVKEKALEFFIDDIKNLPYFFFNVLKDCDSNELKNIINS